MIPGKFWKKFRKNGKRIHLFAKNLDAIILKKIKRKILGATICDECILEQGP